MVVYSNKIKITQLNIKPSTIKKHTEVSKQVAVEMARNIKQKFNSDFSIFKSGMVGIVGFPKKFFSALNLLEKCFTSFLGENDFCQTNWHKKLDSPKISQHIFLRFSNFK